MNEREQLLLEQERTANRKIAEAYARTLPSSDSDWNDAIEAAAKLVENYGPYNQDKAAKIRELKRTPGLQ